MLPRLYSNLLSPPWLVRKYIRNTILKNADQFVIYANEMRSIVPLNKRTIVVYNTINQESGVENDADRDKLVGEVKSLKATKFVYAGTLGENYDLTCIISAFKRDAKWTRRPFF